ncbi:MAG: hypothetical protein K5875_05455 [Saccharofermentans sp.]|nr:hypothetical protein [Saccharofermentans sp.]
MGFGSYRSADWSRLKTSRGINSNSNVNDLFKNKHLDEKYDPLKINMRESRDSEDSPESTPIIISFDDTGSMGYLATEIATNSLNKTVTEIYDKNPVTNPHVMCAAYGNAGDVAPLQVTQFEADIKIVEQLLDLWMVLRGRGDSGDPLIWYFAAKHTSIDSYEKRGKKGFLFTIGDDTIKGSIAGHYIKEIFDDDEYYTKYLAPEEILAMAREKYHVFHIVTKPLNANVYNTWRKLLPDSTALVSSDNISNLYMVIISLMQMVNGQSKEDVINQWPAEVRNEIRNAVCDIKVDPPKNSQAASGAQEEPKKTLLDKLFGN